MDVGSKCHTFDKAYQGYGSAHKLRWLLINIAFLYYLK
jgi:ribosomal protein L20A (L18A)